MTGSLDNATAAALKLPANPVTSYTVLQADADKVIPTPKDWHAKAKMQYLGYSSLLEAVAEKHHCSQALLASLNPKVNVSKLKAGDTLNVPAVESGAVAKAVRLEIDMASKMIRACPPTGTRWRCSIAASRPSPKNAPRPTRTSWASRTIPPTSSIRPCGPK